MRCYISRVTPLVRLLPALASLALAAPAFAVEVPLRELPADKVAGMAPLLRHGEIALIESEADGHMKQVSVMALVAAPPAVVREVLTTPEKFPEFIRNLSKSEVHRNPDGTIDFDFGIDLKVIDLEAGYRIHPRPDGGLYVTALNPGEANTTLYQLYAVPGGTVMVQYGYVDVIHSNAFITRIVRSVPTLEHGLALALQMFYVCSVKARAEKLAAPGSFPPLDPNARGPGFRFLLERGRVAVIRSTPEGHLADISILDTIYAPRDKVADVIDHPNDYHTFVDGMRKSWEVKRSGTEVEYQAEFDVSIFSWSTRFALRSELAALDAVGIDGSLRGAHYRWDLSATKPKETQLVFRANQNLRAASPLILGAIFKQQPLFEHGLSVAVGLVNVIGVRGRAEGWR
jgi:hypothetical protein